MPQDIDLWQYKILSKDQVPDCADWGTSYQTVALDPSVYLHYLQAQCLAHKIHFRRAAVSDIKEAFDLAFSSRTASGTIRAEAVVNCTGLSASRLGGVNDDKMIPMLGQLVIVENESRGMFELSGHEDMMEEIGECSYIIERPAGMSHLPVADAISLRHPSTHGPW